MSYELALQEIERHVKVYKAFQEAQNALTALASLEQNTKELEASKAVLEASLGKVKAEIKDKQQKSTDLDKKLAEKELFVNQAILGLEQEKIDALRATYASLKETEDNNLKSIQTTANELKAKSTKYSSDIATKQTELDVLEAKVAAAKVQMQKMLNTTI